MASDPALYFNRDGSGQNSLLVAVAEAARRLLSTSDLDAAVNGALEAIALAAGIDRIYLLQHQQDGQTQSNVAHCPYEWTAPGIIRSTDIPGHFPINVDVFGDWFSRLYRGEWVQGLRGDLPEAAQQIVHRSRAVSLLVVPIAVEDKAWGIIGFDDCVKERIWSEDEVAILKTASACIGSAIERDRARKERDIVVQARSQELETYNQQLQTRDDLLNCVNSATQCLVATDDFSTALPSMLQILGEGTQQCRAYILRISQDEPSHEPMFHLDLEWDAPHIPSKVETGGEFPVPIRRFPDDLVEPLKAGQATQFLARDLDGIRAEDRMIGQARSLMGVPIMVRGKWWGLLGLDNCREERIWSAAEITVLETAATAVGNAIEREQIRQAREEAERTALIERERAARADELEVANQILLTRDRWLETTAAAANQLLSSTDVVMSVNLALKTLGENLECDRLGLMHYIPETDGLGLFRVLYEWDTTGAPCQMTDDELQMMPATDLAGWTERLMEGESVGGLTVEQAEPFRTKLVALKIRSTYAVPIFVRAASELRNAVEDGDSFWGFMFMDYCQTERQLTTPELAVFNTAATCVGSAIYQDNVRQAREKAERKILLEQAREQATQSRAAQLQKSNEILSLRERWLDVTATAANMLLLADDLDSAIAPTMQVLGEGLEADRVGIMKAIERHGQQFYRMFAEWTSPTQPSQTEDEALQEIPAAILGDRLNERLMSGNWVGGDLSDDSIFSAVLSEGLKSIGIQTSYSVPIFVSGQFWGVIGIDHCREKRLLTETEISVFQTIASCFGNAIQREQILQAREAAERTALIERERAARADELEAANQILLTRDRWLEATAAAANKLLSATEVTASVDSALKTIGENLECDRIVVMRHFPSASRLGTLRAIHEWAAPGISSQLYHPELKEMASEGIEDWFTQLMSRQWVGGVIDLVSDDPLSRMMKRLKVRSTYSVPIFVDEQFWGIMGMDYCHDLKHLSPAEIAVFETAATCVGSAIDQAQVRRDRAAQERAQLLSCVAEAANLLLRSTDYTSVLPEVVRLLGEAVICDRCCIGQDVMHPTVNRAAVQLQSDWRWCRLDDASSGASISNNSQFFLWDDAPNITQKLRGDDVVNCLVIDLPEPDQSFISAQDSISILYVPVMVEHQLWGFIAFDNCTELRLYADADVAILRVAAESIAAAISRQAQETSVRESEERYRNLFEVSSGGFYRFEYDQPISLSLPLEAQIRQMELNFTIAECNQTYSKVFGIDNPDDLAGCKIADFSDLGSEEILAFIRAYIDNGYQLQNYESQGLDQAGQPIHFLTNVIGVIKDGYTLGGWGSQLDITELKLAQEAQETAEKAILQEQEKAARDRAAELAKINEAISKTLTTLAAKPELEKFLGNILAEMADQTAACKVHLFLYDPVTETLTQRVAVQDGQIYLGAGPHDPEMFYRPIPANLTPAWQRILNSPKPLTYDESFPYDESVWWPNSLDWHRAQGHKAVTCIPMKAGEQPIGFIGFCFYNRMTLSEEQLEFMQALANQAIVAIQLTRLAKQSQASALLDERNRLAREIHDTLAQAFTGISLQLEAAKGVLNHQSDAAHIHIQRASQLARRGLSEARRSVRALRSQALETDALPDALKKNLSEAVQDTTLKTQFWLQGSPVPLPEEIQLNLLRIGQEAITNTLRHAQAQTLTLTLTFTSQQVSLQIVDDGIGFDTQSLMDVTGFGLVGIRERVDRCAGTFQIVSHPKAGTRIEVTLPLDFEGDNEF